MLTPILEHSTRLTRQYLLGNETARTELGRRGRQLVCSRHNYTSRVLSILSTMEDVLALKSQEVSAEGRSAEAPASVPLGITWGGATNVEARGDAIATAIQRNLLVSRAASPLPPRPPTPPGHRYCSDMVAASPVYLPKADPSTPATNDTTTAIMRDENVEGVLPSSCRSPEGVPTGDTSVEEMRRERTAGFHPDSFPPPALPRVASSNAAQHRSDQKKRATATDRIGDENDGGGGAVDRSGNRRTKTGSELPEAVPNFALHQSVQRSSSVLVRPNAPMVLVIYRSDSPPPENMRRDLESAASTVAGGALMDFMEISATLNAPDHMSEAFGSGGAGVGKEEDSRRKILEARLSQLLAGADSGMNRDQMSLRDSRRTLRNTQIQSIRFR